MCTVRFGHSDTRKRHRDRKRIADARRLVRRERYGHDVRDKTARAENDIVIPSYASRPSPAPPHRVRRGIY